MSRATIATSVVAVVITLAVVAVAATRDTDTDVPSETSASSSSSSPSTPTTPTTPTPTPTRSAPTTATSALPAPTASTAATTTMASDADGFADLTITVSTDRDSYASGEDVVITISSCNDTDEAYTQYYTSPLYETRVVDAAGVTIADEQWKASPVQAEVSTSWQPHECKRREIRWKQNTGPLHSDGSDPRSPGPRAPVGTYTVAVEWHGKEDRNAPMPKPTIESARFDLR